MSKPRGIALYDFDHTIYRGDASRDFIVFAYRKLPFILIRHLPAQMMALVLYILGSMKKDKAKEQILAFVKDIPDLKNTLDQFWKRHSHKVEGWYLKQRKNTDVIVSSSPSFLIDPIAREWKATVIATTIDPKTGHLTGSNCFGEEKVRRIRAVFPDATFATAYSDSANDIPMLKLAKVSYLVRGGKVSKIGDYRVMKSSMFKTTKFIRFILIGGVNALIGLALVILCSLFIDSGITAFIVGYLLSLPLSFYLNGVFTFKDTQFTMAKFGRFLLSYIPNFIVQLTVVYILIGHLGFPKIPTYIISIAIGVPVTFALLYTYTFIRERRA